MFRKKTNTGTPTKPSFLPPPPLGPTVRYSPLFNYIELLSGKELSDGDKKTIITLAEAGIAPKWPPN